MPTTLRTAGSASIPITRSGPWSTKSEQGVGVDEVAHVQQFAQQFPGRGRIHAGGRVERLRRGQMVGGGAHPADAGGDERHAVGFHPHQHPLEAAQLVHHQSRRDQRAVVAQVQKHLGVALDAGHRIDRDGFLHASASISAIHFLMRKVGLPPISGVAMA